MADNNPQTLEKPTRNKKAEQGDIECRHLNDRWKNRRQLAWLGMWAMIITTAMMMFIVPIERLKVLSEVITWFYFVMGSVVGSYVGFSTLDYIKTKK